MVAQSPNGTFSQGTISQVMEWTTPGVQLCFSEILYRLLTVAIESWINWKNYEQHGRTMQIMHYAFTFDNRIKKFLSLPIMAIMLFYITHTEYVAWNISFLKIAVSYVTLRLLNFTYSNIEMAKFIRSGVGIDYATGMASNYFHGYLHLQLPKTGHETKGLRERIEDYEDKEGVTFPIKKLFILIPQSMHTKPTIESKIMIPVKSLESVVLDRAGVPRPFKNAVYRISCEDENQSAWYVVLEGATPMMSFYESLMHLWTSTTEMQDMKREITLQFYRALKKIILSCPDTKDLIELIYYNDSDVDVGEVVRQRIKSINL